MENTNNEEYLDTKILQNLKEELNKQASSFDGTILNSNDKRDTLGKSVVEDKKEKALENLQKEVMTINKKNLQRRLSRVKETFLEWSFRTDLNNYGKIFDYQGNILAQTVWITIFIVLTVLTVLLIQMSISAYLSYEVTTTNNVIYESQAEFPAVTICANSPFGTQKAAYLFRNIFRNNSLTNIEDLTRLAKMYTANPTYGDENRKQLGFSINDIVSCKFNKQDCKNDLHWIWLYDYGNCFQFNTGLNFSNHKSSRTDTAFGLNVEVNRIFNRKYSIRLLNSVLYFNTTSLITFIHNKSNRITDSSKFFTYFPFSMLLISIDRTFLYKQPSPYSDCIDLSSYSSVFYNYIKESNYTYRQIDCIDLCMQQEIIDACNCYDLRFPKLKNEIKACLNLTKFNCSENAINNFDSKSCVAQSCPLECNSIKYYLEDSSSNLPIVDTDMVYYNNYKNKLIVYYSSLQSTIITQSPQITFINLLTQLGGSLGMFISFSVFALFEIIELFILMIHASFF
jgi:hypothetical protein